MRVRRSQHLERYRIRGGNRLHGEVEISGAKNAAVAIIPAALMVNGKCRIENLPQISDTEALLLILESLGANRPLHRGDRRDERHLDGRGL